jgi:hypothetical protein
LKNFNPKFSQDLEGILAKIPNKILRRKIVEFHSYFHQKSTLYPPKKIKFNFKHKKQKKLTNANRQKVREFFNKH